MNLDKYLKSKGFKEFEGNSFQIKRQVRLLRKLANNNSIKNILEIGFNAGHSSEIFLSCNSNCQVVSFDIGKHNYLQTGKSFLDEKYPGRHSLIIGNSIETVPKYYPGFKFDLIFIDGGHKYNIALNDILNCRRLAHKDTIVIIDDTIFNRKMNRNCNIGPTNAWYDCIENKIIENISNVNFREDRGMSWGKYIFK